MRGLTRRWVLPNATTECDGPAATQRLPLVERVLHARGLIDADAIARFCEPKLTHLHDPATLPGVVEAAQRLVEAVRAERRIVIYGDYDVDGVTATAILFHIVKSVAPAARIDSYTPHRLEEGYGLNCDAIAKLAEGGAQLIISVDCGITAVEPARIAREKGVQLIIVDHHNPPANGELPDALIVHPDLPGSEYPNRDLCGAGVAYKLAWQFAKAWSGSERVGKSLQETLLHLLPLAALGTIADVVPLVGENRVITAFGLRLMHQTPYEGLREMIHSPELVGQKIDSEKVGFFLAPRLNAVGRLGHAAEAVELLTRADKNRASQIVHSLAEHNRQRQQTERRIFEQASRMAEDRGMTRDDCRAIVLSHVDWHPGVVGIVCSRLVDRFGRPAILLQQQGEVCKGSGRGIDGFDLYAALANCAAHLEHFGGHELAAGLAVKTANLHAFTESFASHASERIAPEQLVPGLNIDCDAMLDELDMPMVDRLNHLAPFGRKNRQPTIRVRDLVVEDSPKQIGQYGRHLTVRLRSDEERERRSIRTVWWSGGRLAGELAPGMRVDVALEPKINEFNGRRSVEAVIKDVMIRA